MPTITVPATIDHLTPAKEYLREAIPPEFAAQTSNVLLVAEELLMNVFSYAYPNGSEGRASVSLDKRLVEGKEMLVFTVTDWGEPFNPFEEVNAPDLSLDIDSRPVGGLGVFLIKQVSERQTYAYVDGTNHIEIFFEKEPIAA